MWVDLFGKFEGIAVREISVSRSDCKDEAGLSPYKLEDHALDLLLYVNRLVADRHFRETRQVDEGQVKHWNKYYLYQKVLKDMYSNFTEYR